MQVPLREPLPFPQDNTFNNLIHSFSVKITEIHKRKPSKCNLIFPLNVIVKAVHSVGAVQFCAVCDFAVILCVHVVQMSRYAATDGGNTGTGVKVKYDLTGESQITTARLLHLAATRPQYKKCVIGFEWTYNELYL